MLLHVSTEICQRHFQCGGDQGGEEGKWGRKGRNGMEVGGGGKRRGEKRKHHECPTIEHRLHTLLSNNTRKNCNPFKSYCWLACSIFSRGSLWRKYNQHTMDVVSHGGFPDSANNTTGYQLHSIFR